MTQNHQTNYTKDSENKKIHVTREFDASIEQVWKAWTDSTLLDQWWAPKPYKAKTKSMEFRQGGQWLYAMVGPDGTEQNCCVQYESIADKQMFSGTDAFCDAAGNIDHSFPSMHWTCRFLQQGDRTRVEVEVTFKSLEDLQKIVEMGFQEGFAAAHGNLDEILQQQAVAS